MNKTGALIHPTLANPPFNRALWFITLMVVGSLIITISAKIKVPMWPVDMSLQTLAIFTIAATFGLRLGLATILLYLAQGALGLPVFQGSPERGIGIAYMMGSTGGYLVGFVAMTLITGWAADRGWWRNPFKIGAAMLLGEIVLLLLGAFWLAYLFGVSRAFEYGIGPFIVADLLKVAIAAGIVSVIGVWVRKLSDSESVNQS
jgi:biotin transport system substrate-specific component